MILDNPKRTTYLCVFPRLPIHPSQPCESVQTLSTFSKRDSLRPRILPVKPQPHHLLPLDVNSPTPNTNNNYTLAPRPRPFPPSSSSPDKKTATPRIFSSSTAHPRPLRLVQQQLPGRRQPPVFLAKSTHTLVQSLTYLTIHHHPPPEEAMASSQMNPLTLPKTTAPVPGGANKDQLLADLRRQVLFSSPPPSPHHHLS